MANTTQTPARRTEPSPAGIPGHPPGPWPIGATTAQRRHAAGALLLDIRPQVARHQGSITDAVVMDADAVAERFNLQSPQRIPGLNHTSEIVVCSVSSRRAIPTAELLTQLGYRNVYYLAGGYDAWRSRHTSTPRCHGTKPASQQSHSSGMTTVTAAGDVVDCA
jgi:rhodanese-related sulfurtransferase